MNVIEPSGSACRLVDVCIQKNISFEGKPLTPTSLSSGFSETLSLREQLKQAEERAEQLQRQVCWGGLAGAGTLGWYTGVDKLGQVHWAG